jgi:hypothetical protein
VNRDSMTLDEALFAYTAGLDAELAILQQVEALAAEQRAVWARNELLPLGALATRRAALMHELTAVESRVAPLRDRVRADLDHARRSPGYAAAEARRVDVQARAAALMAADRQFLTDLEATLEGRRREVHDLDTGGATLAAYRRIVVPDVASAGLFDSRG